MQYREKNFFGTYHFWKSMLASTIHPGFYSSALTWGGGMACLSYEYIGVGGVR